MIIGILLSVLFIIQGTANMGVNVPLSMRERLGANQKKQHDSVTVVITLDDILCFEPYERIRRRCICFLYFCKVIWEEILTCHVFASSFDLVDRVPCEVFQALRPAYYSWYSVQFARRSLSQGELRSRSFLFALRYHISGRMSISRTRDREVIPMGNEPPSPLCCSWYFA